MPEAETKYREALAMWRRLFGNENDHVALSLRTLALMLLEQGKLAEAETSYREALAIQRKLFGNSQPWTIHFVNDLKVVCRREFKRRNLCAFKRRNFTANNFPRFRARYFGVGAVVEPRPRTGVTDDE